MVPFSRLPEKEARSLDLDRSFCLHLPWLQHLKPSLWVRTGGLAAPQAPRTATRSGWRGSWRERTPTRGTDPWRLAKKAGPSNGWLVALLGDTLEKGCVCVCVWFFFFFWKPKGNTLAVFRGPSPKQVLKGKSKGTPRVFAGNPTNDSLAIFSGGRTLDPTEENGDSGEWSFSWPVPKSPLLSGVGPALEILARFGGRGGGAAVGDHGGHLQIADAHGRGDRR